MKKARYIKLICVCLSCFLIVSVAFASSSNSNSWNKSEIGYGYNGEYASFWPGTGTLTAIYDSTYGYAMTRAEFIYGTTSAAFSAVHQEDDLYPGMEIRDYSNGSLDNFSVYSIYTNLPNPVTDKEDDDFFGDRNEEAEVTVLGPIVSGKIYNLTAYWDDYRNSSSSGNWAIKAELSRHGISDYNVVDYKYLNADVPYGPKEADTSISSSLEPTRMSANTCYKASVVPATITLNNYLSFDDLSFVISENSATIAELQLRGITPDGERVTIFTRVDKGFDETEAILTEQATIDGFSIVGITAVFAYVDVNQIEALKHNQFVYDVAVTAHATADAHPLSGYETEIAAISPRFAHPLTWELEDAGVMNCFDAVPLEFT